MLPVPVPDRRPAAVLRRAALSPSAGIAAAAGAGIGVADRSAVLAVILGVAAWGARIGAAALRAARDRSSARLARQIDPWALPDPWRQLVQRAVGAGDHFDAAVDAWPSGPLRERLDSLRPSVHAQVRGVWDSARQGATLTGGYPPGTRHTEPAELSAEMKELQHQRSYLPAGDTQGRADLDRREEALATQLQAALRATSTAAAVQDRLRILTAQLEEAVTTLVRLTAAPGGAADLEGFAGSVDSVGREIAALQSGFMELSGAPIAPPAQPTS